jgi:hypothetical protein
VPTYHSQAEKDLLLDETVFCELLTGVFVDVVAHDGVSFVFERDRGWSGVHRSQPERLCTLATNRSAICLNVAVSKDIAPMKKGRAQVSS